MIGVSSEVLIEFLASGPPHLRQLPRICENASHFFGEIDGISRLEVEPGATVVDDLGDNHRHAPGKRLKTNVSGDNER